MRALFIDCFVIKLNCLVVLLKMKGIVLNMNKILIDFLVNIINRIVWSRFGRRLRQVQSDNSWEVGAFSPERLLRASQ